MSDDYIKDALKTIDDPSILINVVARRVKQPKRDSSALVESLQKLSAEATALREAIEGKNSTNSRPERTRRLQLGAALFC